MFSSVARTCGLTSTAVVEATGSRWGVKTLRAAVRPVPQRCARTLRCGDFPCALQYRQHQSAVHACCKVGAVGADLNHGAWCEVQVAGGRSEDRVPHYLVEASPLTKTFWAARTLTPTCRAADQLTRASFRSGRRPCVAEGLQQFVQHSTAVALRTAILG
jgi:hypothetical protein